MTNKLLIFSCILFLFSCGNTAQQGEQLPNRKAAPAIVTGTISGPLANSIQLSSGAEVFHGPLENGKFELVKELKEAGFFTLKHGNRAQLIFLKPGDHLEVTASGGRWIQDITFTGDSAPENLFLKTRMQQQRSFVMNAKDNYRKSEAEFMTDIDSYKQNMEAAIDVLVKENPQVAPEFVAMEKRSALYDWATEYHNFLKFHPIYSGNKDYQASSAFLAYKKQVNLNDKLAINTRSYQNYVVYHAYDKGAEILNNSPELQAKENGYTLANLQAVKQEFTESKVSDYLNFSIIQDHIQNKSINNLSEIVNGFLGTTKNETYKQIIQRDFNKWAVLSRGTVAPVFAYPDIQGKSVALNDLKGKFVYIDVWATWCGPCKREIPHLEKLQETFKDNSKIVFASVSIDKNKDAWAKMVKEKEMKGLQLIAENAGSSQICRDYLISGIPRFILIDDEGKIINAKAPRPSAPELAQILSDLVKES